MSGINKYNIGDRLKVIETYSFYNDWKRDTLIVCGVHHKETGVEYDVKIDGENVITSDFREEDLIPVDHITTDTITLTREEFVGLRNYLTAIKKRHEVHSSGRDLDTSINAEYALAILTKYGEKS